MREWLRWCGALWLALSLQLSAFAGVSGPVPTTPHGPTASAALPPADTLVHHEAAAHPDCPDHHPEAAPACHGDCKQPGACCPGASALALCPAAWPPAPPAGGPWPPVPVPQVHSRVDPGPERPPKA